MENKEALRDTVSAEQYAKDHFTTTWVARRLCRDGQINCAKIKGKWRIYEKQAEKQENTTPVHIQMIQTIMKGGAFLLGVYLISNALIVVIALTLFTIFS